MSASLDALIPELQPAARDLVDAAGAAGLLPQITSTLRSYAEQKRLYSRYLAGLSPYPAAPPGHSAHEYGWAFDIVVSPLDALADVGAYWEQQGGVWGGRIGDDVHFEYPGFKRALGGQINAAQAADDASQGFTQTAIDVGAGFIPVFGEVQLGAQIMEMLGFPQNQITDLLRHPSKLLIYLPQFQLLKAIFG